MDGGGAEFMSGREVKGRFHMVGEPKSKTVDPLEDSGRNPIGRMVRERGGGGGEDARSNLLKITAEAYVNLASDYVVEDRSLGSRTFSRDGKIVDSVLRDRVVGLGKIRQLAEPSSDQWAVAVVPLEKNRNLLAQEVGDLDLKKTALIIEYSGTEVNNKGEKGRRGHFQTVLLLDPVPASRLADEIKVDPMLAKMVVETANRGPLKNILYDPKPGQEMRIVQGFNEDGRPDKEKTQTVFFGAPEPTASSDPKPEPPPEPPPQIVRVEGEVDQKQGGKGKIKGSDEAPPPPPPSGPDQSPERVKIVQEEESGNGSKPGGRDVAVEKKNNDEVRDWINLFDGSSFSKGPLKKIELDGTQMQIEERLASKADRSGNLLLSHSFDERSRKHLLYVRPDLSLSSEDCWRAVFVMDNFVEGPLVQEIEKDPSLVARIVDHVSHGEAGAAESFVGSDKQLVIVSDKGGVNRIPFVRQAPKEGVVLTKAEAEKEQQGKDVKKGVPSDEEKMKDLYRAACKQNRLDESEEGYQAWKVKQAAHMEAKRQGAAREAAKDGEKMKRTAQNPLEYFQGEGLDCSLRSVADSSYVKKFERVKHNRLDSFDRNQAADKASKNGLNQLILLEMLEAVGTMSEEDRSSKEKVAMLLMGKAGEIEKTAREYLLQKYEGQPQLSMELDGYAAVQVMREAARLYGEQSLREIDKRALEKTEPMGNEPRLRFDKLGEALAEVEKNKDGGGEGKTIVGAALTALGAVLGSEGVDLAQAVTKKIAERLLESARNRRGKGEQVQEPVRQETPRPVQQQGPEVVPSQEVGEKTPQQWRDEWESVKEVILYAATIDRAAGDTPEETRKALGEAHKRRQEMILEAKRAGVPSDFKTMFRQKMADLVASFDSQQRMRASSGMPTEDPTIMFLDAIDDFKRNRLGDKEKYRPAFEDWLDVNLAVWMREYYEKRNGLGDTRKAAEQQKTIDDLGWGRRGAATDLFIGRMVDRALERERRGQSRQEEARPVEQGRGTEMTGLPPEPMGQGFTEEKFKGLPVIESEKQPTGKFSETFVEEAGLPPYIYMATGIYKAEKIDTRVALESLMAGQDPGFFNVSSIQESLIQAEKQRALEENRQPDLAAMTAKGIDSYNQFIWGWYKLMAFNMRDTNSTLKAWVGSEGNAGVINNLEPNLKWMANSVSKSPQAKKAMRVWLALGGSTKEDFREIPGMTTQEREIVERHYEKINGMMRVKEYKEGEVNDEQVLVDRQMGVEELDRVQKEIVAELGLDEGVAVLTRKFAGLIAWNPESMVDARKLYANYEKYLKGDKIASVSPLSRARYGEGPAFAEDLLEGGIDAMLDSMYRYTYASSWLVSLYGGMSGFMKDMQYIDEVAKGNDEFANVADRRKALIERITKMMAHKEFPPMENKTANDLKQMELPGGKGEQKAADFNWRQTPAEGLSDSFLGDIWALIKGKK